MVSLLATEAVGATGALIEKVASQMVVEKVVRIDRAEKF